MIMIHFTKFIFIFPMHLTGLNRSEGAAIHGTHVFRRKHIVTFT